MKIYFLEAFFLILLCLHQTIKTFFSVALAQETRTTGWPAWPPDLPFFNFEGLRASWHSTSTYQNVVGMKITNFEECFFSYWIAQSRVDFQTRVRFPNKFWLSFIVRYTDSLPWWLRWLRICLQCGRLGFNPWVKKRPWRREWQSTPVFLPGEFHGQRRLMSYSPWGHRESDTTEQLKVSLQFISTCCHIASRCGYEDGNYMSGQK